MAIKNINSIVDKSSELNYLNNSDFITKYYNEALANLGQRNIEDTSISYKIFTMKSLVNSLIESNKINGLAYVNDNDNDCIPADYVGKIPFKNENNKLKVKATWLDSGDSVTDDDDDHWKEISTIVSSNNADTVLKKKVEMVKCLIEKINEDLNDSAIQNNGTGNDVVINPDIELVFPANYEIIYIVDQSNETLIYGTIKDIYVDIVPSDDSYVSRSSSVYAKQNLKKYISTTAYYIYFNTGDASTSDDMHAKAYISNELPYINEDNNWVIDGIDTGINAKARDAVNLNIILAMSKRIGSQFSITVLSGLNKFSMITKVQEKKAYVKRSNGKVFETRWALPSISVDSDENDGEDVSTSTLLENSTIILISKIYDAIDQSTQDKSEIVAEYGNGNLTTIWTYDKTSNEYVPVSNETTQDNKPIAVDINQITNVDNFLDYKVAKIKQVEPDNFLFSYMIFDQVLQSNKQATDYLQLYPVLQNLYGSNYNNKYINNLNFSLRYLNTIDGTIGQDIKKVFNTSEGNFLKIVSGASSSQNYVTNSMYQTIVNNKTNYYNEYVPNYNIPVFDMSEFLSKDFNVINRTNVLSFSNTGQIYYAYMGTVFDKYDKTSFHIGTYTTNINLGETTLASPQNKSKFLEHDSMSIDFKTTYINSETTSIIGDLSVDKSITTSNAVWTKQSLNSNEILSTTVIPKFVYNVLKPTSASTEVGTEYNIIDVDNMANGLVKLINNQTDDDEGNNALYFNIILMHDMMQSNGVVANNAKYYYKYNDLLIIDKFIKWLGLDPTSISDIISSTNEIIYYNDKPKLLVSSSNQLASDLQFQSSSDNDIAITINKSNNLDFYVANALDVILATKNNITTLVINEHKSPNKIKPIFKLPSRI